MRSVLRRRQSDPSSPEGPRPTPSRPGRTPSEPTLHRELSLGPSTRGSGTLQVAPTDSDLEREADRVARAPRPPVGRAGRQLGASGDPGAGGVRAGFAPASVHTVLRRPGRPLDAGTRTRLEPRLGHDLTTVRIHDGAPAARAASEVGARAFTVGDDVVFGRDRYRPDTTGGRRTLAHELAHVVQQRQGVAALLQRDPEQDEEEETPQAEADPAAHQLSSTLSEEERTRLVLIGRDVDLTNLGQYFSTEGATTTIHLPDGVTVRWGGAIDSALHHGLRNVAAHLVPDTLPLNATLTVEMDLTAWGGGPDAYRFTYLQREGEDAGREVLVERLGRVGPSEMDDARRDAQEQRFQSHGFSWSGSWSRTEKDHVLRGIEAVPDADLGQVVGLTFQRESASADNPRMSASYDVTDHSIQVYDRAFTSSSTRFGTPGSATGFHTNAGTSIVHEIGHALDLREQRARWAALQSAKAALEAAFPADEEGQHSWSGGPEVEERFNRLYGAANEAQDALDDVRSRSGAIWTNDGGWEVAEQRTGQQQNDFRQAARADGAVFPTDYPDPAEWWQEFFAESYTLYRTSPQVLEQLRPHVYAYFTTNHPG